MKRNVNPTSSRPRGTAYVLVLCIAALVTIAGVAALTFARVQLRSAALSNDAEEARVCAQSGVELAKLWCLQDPSWRTNRADGKWATGVALGNGSFSVTAMDPVDNDIANGALDPLVITATGFKGRARQRIVCTLSPAPVAYSCLSASITSGGNMTISSGAVLSANAAAASNGNVSVSGSGTTIEPDVEAVGSITGSGYLGSCRSNSAARGLPDSSAFDYYVANGSSIPYASLPSHTLQNVLLSPTSNPYGPTNPNGIYVIDCGGQTIDVQMVRIVGTLVLLNPKNDSTIAGEVNCEPAVPNYPVLMVRGSITCQFDANSLSEASVGVNYNPPTTPYASKGNTTTSDSYPSILNGLVYVSGSLSIKAGQAYGGPVVVGGTCTADHDARITWSATWSSNPPPGFYDNPPMKVVASTWAQGVQ